VRVNSVDSYNFFTTWISFYDKNKEQLWGISPLFLTIIPVNNPQNAPKIAKENSFILKFKRIDACRYIPWGPTSKKQNTLSVPVKFWPVGHMLWLTSIKWWTRSGPLGCLTSIKWLIFWKVLQLVWKQNLGPGMRVGRQQSSWFSLEN